MSWFHHMLVAAKGEGTEAALARRIHVSPSKLSSWMSGGNPSDMNELEEILQAFGGSIELALPARLRRPVPANGAPFLLNERPAPYLSDPADKELHELRTELEKIKRSVQKAKKALQEIAP